MVKIAYRLTKTDPLVAVLLDRMTWKKKKCLHQPEPFIAPSRNGPSLFVDSGFKIKIVL